MLKHIDEALIVSLKNGLSGMLPSENIVLGNPQPKKRAVFLSNTDFTIEETSMGTLSEEQKEEVEETLDADGKNTAFKLSKAPVNRLISVEYPRGRLRTYPDDYEMDHRLGVITFRDPPPKAKAGIRIRYDLPRPTGESSYLKFILMYTIAIFDDDEGRDRITLAAIETLYRDMPALVKQGVEDIKLIRGYSAPYEGDKAERASFLVYSVQASMRLETKLPPIEKVQIKKK
jgi:hypothetical protein